MEYVIVTTHVFKASTPPKRTPVACVVKKTEKAALKEAKDSLARYECIHHQNFGFLLIVVRDEDENFIRGYVSYRDGFVKEILPPT
jgi:hypothetical protein